jgi:hypothetical protein
LLIIDGENQALIDSYPDAEKQQCFYCGKEIGGTHGVFWTVGHNNGESIYLHADCTLEFASRLMAELGVLQQTLAHQTPRRSEYWGVHGFFERAQIKSQETKRNHS